MRRSPPCRTQAGSGAGIYKMASSLGASFGVAISATVFTALSEGSKAVEWTEGVISYVGRQDNVNIREAGLAAFGVNLAFVVLAIISIMVTIPERKPREMTPSSRLRWLPATPPPARSSPGDVPLRKAPP